MHYELENGFIYFYVDFVVGTVIFLFCFEIT